MAIDLRQLMSGVLTFSMFLMLGNMIKRDHFDGAIVMNIPAASSSGQRNMITFTRYYLLTMTVATAIKEHTSNETLIPCWNKSAPFQKEKVNSKGFILFALSGGPEHHVSQVADAVVVARYLRATLVLPDIIGTKPGEMRSFGEVYDVEKFVARMNGVIQVAKKKPQEVSNASPIIVRVPNGVSEDYVASNVEPFFRKKGTLKLATYFPRIYTRKAEANKVMNTFSCLAMFESLHLEPNLQGVVNSMIEKLRALSSKSNGEFVAVDLRVDRVVEEDCQEIGSKGMKNCYNAEDISSFLKRLDFQRDTTIYLTQLGWHKSLDALKKAFPNTYTKDDIMEDDMKKKYLGSKNFDYGNIIDFQICSRSDMFIPSASGLFYTNVVGDRIANNNTAVLIPARIPSTNLSHYISSYIAKRNHLAFSCLC